MPWYAIDSVSDAFDEAKALLFPFELKRWLVLAVITFFVGGTGSAPSGGGQSVSQPPNGGVPDVPLSGDVWLLVGVLVLVLLVLGVVYLVVGSVMEFVFVDVLRSRDVRIRGPFGERTGPGLRLVGFRLALLVAFLVVAALVVGPIYATFLLGTPIALLPLVLLVPLAVVVGIALAVVQDFTTSFVVPLVCDRGGGIVEIWRRVLWPAVRSEWQQFLLYLVVKWGLGIAIGIAVGIGLLLVALPVMILFGAGLLTGGVSAVLVAVAAVFAIVLFVLVLVFVQMPIAVFLRYYSLSVLEKTDLEWDLHPGTPTTD